MYDTFRNSKIWGDIFIWMVVEEEEWRINKRAIKKTELTKRGRCFYAILSAFILLVSPVSAG